LPDRAVVVEPLAGAAIEPAEMTPAQFKRFIATEAIRWEKIVRDSGARID
jgi:tripartite-type tricarboxylate transporter receptor subunit TctC